ncbi:hypothetical protein HDE_07852 [Halotydeus destructor]|nr:hypothetical protein HDE_07852 [Halotydeus destructor]
MILALSLLVGQRLRSHLPRPPRDQGILYYVSDFWDQHGVEEVRDFPLIAGPPWKLIVVLSLYLYLVAAVWSKQGTLRRPSRAIRAPVTLLLNGSQLGLNGAWLMLAFFVSPMGQRWANENPDKKTGQFIELLRIYVCCCFLLFKLVQLGLSVSLLLLHKKCRLTKLELTEAVTMPVLAYMLAKFGHFPLLLTISLINTLVSAITSAYYTLSSAKVVVPFPNRNWEAILLTLKTLQYSAIYFVGGLYLTLDRSSSSAPVLIKALGVAYATLMNFIVWCSLSLFAVESQ